MSEMEALQVHHQDEHNVVASWRNVFVQLRRGRLTGPDVERFTHLALALRERIPGAAGAFLLVEQSAVVPEEDARVLQRNFIRRLASDTKMHVASVIEGDGVQTMLKRTVARTLIVANPRVKIFATVDPAVAYLAPQVGHTAFEINGLLRQLRSRK